MDDPQKESPEDRSFLELSSLKLLILSLVSANIYVFFSFLIIRYWHEGGIFEVFGSNFSIGQQMGLGTGVGLILAAIIYFVITRTSVKDVLSDFSVFNALSNANFSFFDNTQVSLFAGAGEELLFRGAIQPVLGNTLTSIIFIGIHGYFKFKSPIHIAFGAMMFGLSFTLGLLFEHIGLFAAMAAHAVYDLVMLVAIQRND
ncbi:CPBP family intramembrane glutamic endopeptidase [Gracilimonas tropica]|uniref:CPBP family intramembrane glutamic endopeptidase n=1 Tax=Gracilimonas tropica TaxID=454600 RepID=UPI000375C406|nr:CPBP family intramembrane glutamic endopeptidase [Gracilimonas tropica]